MGVSVQQELLRTERMVGEVTRSCQVEGRLSLPQGIPPWDRVQSSSARVRELRAAAATGRVQVEGLIEAELIYQAPAADVDRPLQPERLVVWSEENGGAIAFGQEIPVAGVLAGATAEARAVVTSVSIQPLDDNSAHCQASLDISVTVTTPQEIKVATEVSGVPADRLEVIKEVLHLESPAGKAEAEAEVSAILSLPEVKPDLVRIVARTARVSEISLEIIRGRALVEGRLEVSTVYVARTEDGGEQLELGEWGGEGRTPLGFEVFVDLPGLGPEVTAEPEDHLGRLSLEVIGPREIKLDATVLLTVRATRPRQVPMVIELIPRAEDLVDLERVQASCSHLVGRAEQEIVVESILELPPGKPDLERILQTRVTPVSLTAQAAEGRCLIDGWLDVSLLYLTELPVSAQSVLAAADWARSQGTGIAVTEVVDLPEAIPGLNASLRWRLRRISVEQVGPRVLRLSVAIPLGVKVTEERIVSAVVEAATVPLAPIPGRPSLLFYVVQPGDTLWTIARRYETTVEALARVNRIGEPGALEAGLKLVIPRTPVAV